MTFETRVRRVSDTFGRDYVLCLLSLSLLLSREGWTRMLALLIGLFTCLPAGHDNNDNNNNKRGE